MRHGCMENPFSRNHQYQGPAGKSNLEPNYLIRPFNLPFATGETEMLLYEWNELSLGYQKIFTHTIHTVYKECTLFLGPFTFWEKDLCSWPWHLTNHDLPIGLTWKEKSQ